jgi:hypothetical protein
VRSSAHIVADHDEMFTRSDNIVLHYIKANLQVMCLGMQAVGEKVENSANRQKQNV